ncbi:hypothetical protein RHIZ404_220771 [Rhizobium sp. EC-SD404]|nr:hypothetical protein RHIZ404_220771 [Rhizobium sp. EC-SD404]
MAAGSDRVAVATAHRRHVQELDQHHGQGRIVLPVGGARPRLIGRRRPLLTLQTMVHTTKETVYSGVDIL